MRYSNLVAEWFAQATALASQIHAALARHRRTLFALALLLFTFGLWISIVEIEIDVNELAAHPFFLNFFVLTPLAFALSAWGLQLTARTIGRSIPFVDALITTAFGTIADLLPVPGGLMARSAALASVGAPPVDIVQVLSLNALLWLGLLTLMGAVALLAANTLATPLILAAIGLPAIVSSLGALSRRAQLRLLLVVLWHRVLSLTVNVLRMAAGFATLQTALGLHEAMVLTAANSLGGFSTAIPSGLGLGEALAALAAVAIALAPALAFAVAALNRILYLMMAGGGALLAIATGWKRDEQI